jgi:hypothetical protein
MEIQVATLVKTMSHVVKYRLKNPQPHEAFKTTKVASELCYIINTFLRPNQESFIYETGGIDSVHKSEVIPVHHL